MTRADQPQGHSILRNVRSRLPPSGHIYDFWEGVLSLFYWQYAFSFSPDILFSLAKFSTHSIFSVLWLQLLAWGSGVGFILIYLIGMWSMCTGMDHDMRSENL